MSRFVLTIGLLLSLLGLTACSHYQLGTGSAPKFSRLYVAPVSTEVLLPQAQAILTTQIREAFLKDGRITLASSPDQAEAILTVVVTGYHRDVAVSQPNDTKLARRFDLTLDARATLNIGQNAAGFTDRPLNVKRGSFQDSGQQQSEYQTLPLLAESLAQQAVHAVLDTW